MELGNGQLEVVGVRHDDHGQSIGPSDKVAVAMW